jgi:hypothetical protein
MLEINRSNRRKLKPNNLPILLTLELFSTFLVPRVIISSLNPS